MIRADSGCRANSSWAWVKCFRLQSQASQANKRFEASACRFPSVMILQILQTPQFLGFKG